MIALGYGTPPGIDVYVPAGTFPPVLMVVLICLVTVVIIGAVVYAAVRLALKRTQPGAPPNRSNETTRSVGDPENGRVQGTPTSS